MPTRSVRLAVTRADYETAGGLAREYVDGLPFPLDFQDFEGELQRLDTEFGPPNGATFLASLDDRPIGIAAVRRLTNGDVELKRMYLRPSGRGTGLAQMLSRHAIAAARRLGGTRLVLDTVVSAMPAANTLYTRLGFVDIEPYRHNPLPDARFMGLELAAVAPAPPVGVIAAGGQGIRMGTRMGTRKGDLDIDGAPMIRRVESTLRHAGLEVAVVGGPTIPDTVSLTDPHGVAGPVAALLAGLRHFPDADIVLVGTDQPYVRPDTIRKLFEVPGAAVVPVDLRRQSLAAVYRHACLEAVERLATTDGAPALQTVLDSVDATEVPEPTWRGWGEDGRSWLSVDTPETLAAVRRAWPDVPESLTRDRDAG